MLEIAQVVPWTVSGTPGLWLRTLWCGPDGALVVAVNERGKSAAEGFHLVPIKDAVLRFPDLPWLAPARVVRVREGGWETLAAHRRGNGLEWRVPVTDAALFLLASEAELDRLDQRAAQRERQRTRAIAAVRQEDLRRKVRQALLVRKLLRLPAADRLKGTPIHGYGIEDRSFWNPAGAPYNAVDFWERKGLTPLGISWTVKIPAALVRRPMTFTWQGRLYGGRVRLTVRRDNETAPILEIRPANFRALEVRRERIVFPAPGVYHIRIVVQPETPREHGGRIARIAFLEPDRALDTAREGVMDGMK
jgi:hypothetical protein